MGDAATRAGRSQGSAAGAGAASESLLRGLVAGEARFRLLADAAPTMLWTAGPASGGTFFNRAWLQFTGRTLQEELGQGWLTGVRPEERDRCVATYAAAYATGEPFAIEFQLRRADGEYRWIHDRGAPVYEGPDVLAGYIGSCQDVTDRVETEASLRRQTARLQALADASQAFAAHHQHPPPRMTKPFSPTWPTGRRWLSTTPACTTWRSWPWRRGKSSSPWPRTSCARR